VLWCLFPERITARDCDVSNGGDGVRLVGPGRDFSTHHNAARYLRGEGCRMNSRTFRANYFHNAE
jgi:hypothetical protein